MNLFSLNSDAVSTEIFAQCQSDIKIFFYPKYLLYDFYFDVPTDVTMHLRRTINKNWFRHLYYTMYTISIVTHSFIHFIIKLSVCSCRQRVLCILLVGV